MNQKHMASISFRMYTYVFGTMGFPECHLQRVLPLSPQVYDIQEAWESFEESQKTWKRPSLLLTPQQHIGHFPLFPMQIRLLSGRRAGSPPRASPQHESLIPVDARLPTLGMLSRHCKRRDFMYTVLGRANFKM